MEERGGSEERAVKTARVRVIGRGFLVVGSLCSVLLCWYLWRTLHEEPVLRKDNIVLVTIAALRADRGGAAGHPASVTPNLDTWAEEALEVERCYSSAGWLLPAAATVLTGLPPHRLGLAGPLDRLPDITQTLAQRLRGLGYHTSAVIGDPMLRQLASSERGFDRVEDLSLSHGPPYLVATAGRSVLLALRSLEAAEEPFFSWINLQDPMAEYLEPVEAEPRSDQPTDLYDGEVAETDRHLGRLFRALERSAVGTRTVVVIVGLFGQEFDDHGGNYHESLFEEIVRVRLVIAVPGDRPRRLAGPALLEDLAPTLLAAVGVPVSEDLPGLDLRAAPVPETRDIFLWRDFPGRAFGLVRGGLKALRHDDVSYLGALPRRHPMLTPGYLLFDLRSDPGEHVEVSEQLGVEGEALRKTLDDYAAEAVRAAQPPPERAVLMDVLRTLGYFER
ncbi:MAG: hypothetical protein A2284_03795 [Deltaproteobacteria bacterium RIFOXYA12_FULL_61_11]|nr:MAG: hypothetical protein A2284_03795 [Deltaproteobacteria bacterium RIFOXYA12_FULL_61_11]